LVAKLSKLLAIIFLGHITLDANAQVFDVPSRSDVPTRTLFISAPNPKAIVLLYPGGGGLLRLQDDGFTRNGHTFVRSKDLWAKYQIDAVLVDTPYDLGDMRRGDLRNRNDHLQRVNEVIEFYQQKFNLPVWIFGHSMGTSTVSNFLNSNSENQKKIEGAIIAGTIRTASINGDVAIPVQAIHHKQDSCLGSLPENSERIIQRRSKEFQSNLTFIDGGITEGNVCDAFAYHGFNQTEPQFVDAAAQFILSH
jgi:pimeloyl-ACP methyl ester carboxylesterase